jgi:hypothetical protein
LSQTSIIFGALFVGWVVYITLKGELPAYAAILLGANGSTSSATSLLPTASTALQAGSITTGIANNLSQVELPQQANPFSLTDPSLYDSGSVVNDTITDDGGI